MSQSQNMSEILKPPSILTILLSFFAGLTVKYTDKVITIFAGFIFIYALILLLHFIYNNEVLYRKCSAFLSKYFLFSGEPNISSLLVEIKFGLLLIMTIIISLYLNYTYNINMITAFVSSFIIYLSLVRPLIFAGIAIGHLLVKVMLNQASDDSVGVMFFIAFTSSFIAVLVSYIIKIQEHKETIVFLISLTFLFIVISFMHNWDLESKRIENSSWNKIE